jgi:hypothetical protein
VKKTVKHPGSDKGNRGSQRAPRPILRLVMTGLALRPFRAKQEPEDRRKRGEVKSDMLQEHD